MRWKEKQKMEVAGKDVDISALKGEAEDGSHWQRRGYP